MLEIGVASGVRLTRATLYELGRPQRRARHFAIVGQAVARKRAPAVTGTVRRLASGAYCALARSNSSMTSAFPVLRA